MAKAFQSWMVAGACLLALAGVAGCGTSSSNNNTSTSSASGTKATAHVMKDGVGHQVKIPAAPLRIWAPGLEDPIVALGDSKDLVGQYSSGNVVDDYLQKWLKGKPHIDFSGNGLDPESILKLNPNLIILYSTYFTQNGKYQQYSKIAPTYVFNQNSGAQGTWRNTLLTLGKMLGKSDKAKQLLKGYDQKVSAAKAKLQKAIGNKTVAIIEPSGKQVFLIGKGNFAGQEVYGDLGLTPPKIATGWASISLEDLPKLGADYIFMVTGNDSTAEEKVLTNNPVWKDLPAVKEGHVYNVSYGHWINLGVIANEDVINDVVNDLTK